MKKIILILLLCFVQNTFSQNTKIKASETKNTEPVIVKVNNNYDDSNLVVDEPASSPKVSTNNDKTIYNTAGIDVKPDFPGGIEKFYKFVDNNFKYPDEDIDLKGKKIYATFIVEQDGSLTDIKILRDAGHGTGAEAIRVLKKCPRWIPGEHNGKKIRVLYSLPITLK